MRTRGWALAALGLFTAGFAAMWILDGSLPGGWNLTDPQLWLGAVLLGAAALAGFARKRSAQPRPVLAGAGIGALGAGLLILGFYGLLGAAMDQGPSMYVEETDEAPVAALDLETTRRQAPELAEALDKLVTTNATEVFVTDDEDTFERIQRYLVDQTGDYVDPFTWRDTVVRVDAIVS